MNPLSFFRTNPRVMRVLACTSMMLFLSEIIYPTAAMALTSGPAQPEFSSFEPVVTTNMVNDFSGDFTYNLPVLQIPGPDGAGYAMSMSYHGGASMEEEASWVGYGWTLNPGAINRQVQGFPDDWKGAAVKQWNQSPDVQTVSLTGQVEPEVFSNPTFLSANTAIRYNNYSGWGYTAGVGLHLAQGAVSLGYSISDGDGSFSLTVNPAKKLMSDAIKTKKDRPKKAKRNGETNTGEKTMGVAKSKQKLEVKKLEKEPFTLNRHGIGNSYGMRAMTKTTYPLSASAMQGSTFSLQLGGMPTASPFQMGTNIAIGGKYAIQGVANSSDSFPAYGYLYSEDGGANANAAMDYHVENLSSYNKRDKFLSVPVSDADLFNITGEGLSGSMRLHRNYVGHFRPREVESNTTMFRLGSEFELGVNNGGGTQFQLGAQKMTVGGWQHQTVTVSNRDEAYFMRMSNDMGGSHLFGTSTSASKGAVSGNGYTDPLFGKSGNSGNRSQRSSYVAYTLNNTQGNLTVANRQVSRYERANINLTLAENSSPNSSPNSVDIGFDPLTSVPFDQISELSIKNGQAQQFNYGLPVYTKNEINMSYSVEDKGVAIENRRWATTNQTPNDQNSAFVQGQEPGALNQKHASTFLLTSITDVDYVDRTLNGPSLDDFGGYTTFRYHKEHGTNLGNWFKYRMPYNGFSYSPGTLSESNDDKISFSGGEKETYYLKLIETKSHIAEFKLNTSSTRKDGKGADGMADAHDSNANGTSRQRYLEEINLYARGEYPNGKPIKTVHFEYYPNGAWPDAPNCDPGEGKLTLKRIWTEYNGVVNAHIAPYEFIYEYPLASTYDQVNLESDFNGANQFPPYKHGNTDPWGTFCSDGQKRAREMTPWLDQKPLSNTEDPAAWQLKQIILPSGGEIHVQYEHDDYLHVQDERAHAMVRVTPLNIGGGHTRFKLDLSEFGIDFQSDFNDVARVRDLIDELYVGKKRKMFFRLLYEFRSDLTGYFPTDPLNSRNHEFIEGYATIHSVGANTTDGVYVTILPNNHGLPQDVCMDLFNSQKRGKDLSANVFNTNNTTPLGTQISDPSPLLDNGKFTGSSAGVITSAVSFLTSFAQPGSTCSAIESTHSHMRIPVPYKKRGGGLRVKRLLMFDPQAQNEGNPSLFGTEYEYKKLDEKGNKVSSGVATYEPGQIRMENAVVQPLARFHQGWLDKAIGGRDRKNSEGPIGESLYPSPSVGYSQILIRNIADVVDTANMPACLPNGSGFVVKEYFTAKDYPVNHGLTESQKMTHIEHIPAFVTILSPWLNSITDHNQLAQGFTIQLNSMHGQMRSETSYSGILENYLDPNAIKPPFSSKTEYEFFEPGEALPVVTDRFGTISSGNGNMPLGQEMEIVTENRLVHEHMDDGSLETDISMGGPIGPQVGVGVTATFSDTKVKSLTTTKVVTYPAVIKRTRTFKDGIYHMNENMAFDPASGEPRIVRTHDGFLNVAGTSIPSMANVTNGTYTKYTIPAHLAYENMGQSAKGEGKKVNTLCPISLICADHASGVVTLSSTTPGMICDLLNSMCEGDLLQLTDGGNEFICHMTGINGSTFSIVATSYSSLPNNGPINVIRILRSGCTNQLAPAATEFTVYEDGSINSSANFALRQQFVDNLNDAVQNLEDRIHAAAFAGNSLSSGDELEPIIVPNGLTFQSQISPTDCGVSTQMNLQADYDIVTNSHPYTINLHTTVTHPKMCETPFEVTASSSSNLQEPWGEFALDPTNGLLVYFEPDNDCFPLTVSCPQFCIEYPEWSVNKVVSCSATEFDDSWSYNFSEYPSNLSTLSGQNDYERGLLGKWRPEHVYAYHEATEDGGRNFNTGWFDMEFFNFDNPGDIDPNKWILTNMVTAYSPHGKALEEENALGIKSCSKYGYDKQLPYLVAQNSHLGGVHFESFEKFYTGTFEDGLVLWGLPTMIDNEVAHSGVKSFKLENTSGTLFQGKEIKTSPQITDNGLLVKAWIRASDGGNLTDALFVKAGLTELTSTGVPSGNITIENMDAIAKSGEWTLYSVRLDVPSSWTNWAGIRPEISCTNSSTMTTWIDDVRVQPGDAQMTTYVYNPTNFRLLATFDDQHFGLFYQYNDEGKLVRKLIETERGMHTIQETQYNVPLRQ